MLLKCEMMLKVNVTNVGSFCSFPSKPLPVILVALVILHEVIIEIFIGKCFLISDAERVGPAHQLRYAELPGVGRRDSITMEIR